MYAYVFADSATVDAPVRIPVRSVAWSFFTFMATLFSTTCELLSIGDLTVHERAPSPQRNRERSEEHTSELQSHRDLHSFPTRRSSDLFSSTFSGRCMPMYLLTVRPLTLQYAYQYGPWPGPSLHLWQRSFPQRVNCCR